MLADASTPTDADAAGASDPAEPAVAAPSQSTWQRLRVPVASAIAVLVVGIVLGLTIGAAGLLVAGAISFVWAVTRVEYAVAVGGVGAVVFAAPDPLFPAVVAGTVLAVFVADLYLRWPRRTAAIAILVLVPAAAALSETARLEPTWLGGLAGIGGFAAVAYTVHRYELVMLGLVEEGET